MTPATRIFHESIIRALRGILTAWDNWVKSTAQETGK